MMNKVFFSKKVPRKRSSVSLSGKVQVFATNELGISFLFLSTKQISVRGSVLYVKTGKLSVSVV